MKSEYFSLFVLHALSLSLSLSLCSFCLSTHEKNRVNLPVKRNTGHTFILMQWVSEWEMQVQKSRKGRCDSGTRRRGLLWNRREREMWRKWNWAIFASERKRDERRNTWLQFTTKESGVNCSFSPSCLLLSLALFVSSFSFFLVLFLLRHRRRHYFLLNE